MLVSSFLMPVFLDKSSVNIFHHICILCKESPFGCRIAQCDRCPYDMPSWHSILIQQRFYRFLVVTDICKNRNAEMTVGVRIISFLGNILVALRICERPPFPVLKPKGVCC